VVRAIALKPDNELIDNQLGGVSVGDNKTQEKVLAALSALLGISNG